MMEQSQIDDDSPITPERLGNDLLKIEDVKYQQLQNTGEPFQQRLPTEKQLCECLLFMKEKMPHSKLKKAIQMLHQICVKEQLEEKEKRERRLERLKNNSLLVDDDYFSGDENPEEIEKKKMQMDYARKFENSDANPRFYEQRQIAKLFCSKGYGYPTARQYLGQNITPNRYNNVITTIVRLSYRKLQYFIMKNINHKLPMISRQELKMIKTPLVNCRNWMTERQAENFHRFVKLTYKIPTDQPEKEIGLQLHESIMDQLKKRNVTYRPHRRGEDHSGWSDEMEQSLIIQYVKSTNIQQIQRSMMLHYSNYRSNFQISKLRHKIDRLIRYSVRRLNQDKERYGMKQFKLINEYNVRRIISSSTAEQARNRLLKYYIDKDRNAMKVRWVYQAIKEFYQLNNKQVQQIEDSSCEILPKEELKAEEKGQVKGEGKKQEQQ